MQKTSLKSEDKVISIAHSPDADDAFMFYALANKMIEIKDLKIEHILKDIQTLNSESNTSKYDVQAISFFAYPEVENEYQLLSCGGSLGYGYGPLLVSKKKVNYNDLKTTKNKTIAVPGQKTTAYLLLKLLLKEFNSITVPFDQVLKTVIEGTCDFGLVIHEGQLSYQKHGLHKVLDFGQWWLGKTNLPVPLGGNIIKRSFKEKDKKEINLLIRKSIAHALANKEKIIPLVSKYARELAGNNALVSKFVSMYVNEFTLDYGLIGRLAIKKLYELSFKEGFINKIPKLDFVVC